VSSEPGKRRRGRARRAPDPDLENILVRLERMIAQERALRRALEAFSDLAEWQAAFACTDPDVINLRVLPVKGNFEALVNHMCEIVKRSHRLADLEPITKSRTVERYVRAVGEAGGLTETQVDRLVELNVMRNRLQHASPDVAADEVWELARVLPRSLAAMRRKLLRWLAASGHEVV
jgi:hypothetical protein